MFSIRRFRLSSSREFGAKTFFGQNRSVKVLYMPKGGKFLKKLWCCVGGEYYKIRSDEELMLETSNARMFETLKFTVANSHYQLS